MLLVKWTVKRFRFLASKLEILQLPWKQCSACQVSCRASFHPIFNRWALWSSEWCLLDHVICLQFNFKCIKVIWLDVFWVFCFCFCFCFFPEGDKMNCHLNICLVKEANWETVYLCMFFFPFWYLCLFLSIIKGRNTPGSQWERLWDSQPVNMASVCLILLSMFGVCVRIVCVHAHVCITRMSSWKDGSHLSTCSSWGTCLKCSWPLSSLHDNRTRGWGNRTC